MNNLDLIYAISAAEPEQLEHSEGTSSHLPRRTLSVLLAAAAVTLLAAAALAVPATRDFLRGLVARPTFRSVTVVERSGAAAVYESYADVYLDVRMNRDAPAVIETYYVPMLPAAQWEPIPLTVSGQQMAGFEKSTLLCWQGTDGSYVYFRQYAVPEYTPEQPLASVCTGYNGVYTVEAAELGGYTVQRIRVEPSAITDQGFCGEHPGQQRLYWSNGSYIFDLEVSYSMTDEEIAEILESIRPVEDVTPYIAVTSVHPDAALAPVLALDEVLFPTALPEACVQRLGVRNSDGSCLFLWQLGENEKDPSVLELSVAPMGENDRIALEWERAVEAYEKTEQTVGTYHVTCYENQWKAQLLWTVDGADYTLKASGPNACSLTQLQSILCSMEKTSRIEEHFMEQ